MTSRSTLPCSAELKEHQSRLQSKGLADLLQAGADRTARFTLQAAGLSIDLSRHYLDDALRATKGRSRLVLQVHDEVVVEAHRSEHDQVEGTIIDIMRGAADLRVPLDVNYAWGDSWGAAKS